MTPQLAFIIVSFNTRDLLDACLASIYRHTQGVTFEIIPETPAGMCSTTDCRFCWPSSRPIVVTSGLNPPALMFVVPPLNDGPNGNA